MSPSSSFGTIPGLLEPYRLKPHTSRSLIKTSYAFSRPQVSITPTLLHGPSPKKIRAFVRTSVQHNIQPTTTAKTRAKSAPLLKIAVNPENIAFPPRPATSPDQGKAMLRRLTPAIYCPNTPSKICSDGSGFPSRASIVMTTLSYPE